MGSMLKKNAMIPLPVATYDIEMVIVIQIRQCNTTSIFITNKDFGFDTVIGLSHLCCYNVLYFLNNPSVIFLTHLHSITKYCTILNSSHQSPVLQLIKHTSIFLQSRRWGIRKGTSKLAMDVQRMWRLHFENV
jgi:hypothetical protein